MNHQNTTSASTLLICSVGGTPEPITTAIRHIKPVRVLLWHSQNTRMHAEQALGDAGFDPDHADYALVDDPQDFKGCVVCARNLHRHVQEWQQRSPGHQVIVDFTGGTKAMSAALALVAHRWDCQFLYIAGQQRTKDGTGVVVTGSESPIEQANPYDALAYQPLQDAVHLFNQRQPAAAAAILEPFTRRNDLDAAIKRQLVAIKHLAQAYAFWDAFRHSDAVNSFKHGIHAANDLNAALPTHGLSRTLAAHRSLCEQLAAAQGQPTPQLVLDLLANADRRAEDGRFDDATARLYRATEALAQAALRHDHQIDAAACPIDQVPESLRQTWASRAANGFLKLALQDAYTLLHELKHPLGQRFRELKLHENPSPLTARNQSILAHGFAPTTDPAFNALKRPVHELAGAPELEAYTFPQLPVP